MAYIIFIIVVCFYLMFIITIIIIMGGLFFWAANYNCQFNQIRQMHWETYLSTSTTRESSGTSRSSSSL